MYEIIWSERAFRAMGRLIASQPHRKSEFSATLKELTKTLKEQPHHTGESRVENLRIFFPGKLTVYFMVDEVAKTVEIVVVGMWKSKPKQ